MIVNLKFLNGNSKEITITSGQTIQDIKVEHLNLNSSNLDDIKIIYSGKILENEQILDDLGLNDKSFFVILTTTKSALESLTSKTNDDESVDDTLSSDSENEIIDGDLFDLNSVVSMNQDDEEEEEPDINYQEVIQKNNNKFLELSQDPKFITLIDIIINKPEYLNYALKFVQSGMIFNRTNNLEESSNKDYSSQFEILKNLKIQEDTQKISRALDVAEGDIQMAIRYMFMSNFDENFEL